MLDQGAHPRQEVGDGEVEHRFVMRYSVAQVRVWPSLARTALRTSRTSSGKRFGIGTRDNGYDVADRGAFSQEVLAAYSEASEEAEAAR